MSSLTKFSQQFNQIILLGHLKIDAMVPNSCCYNRFDLECDTILQSYELTYLFMNPHGVVGQVPLL